MLKRVLTVLIGVMVIFSVSMAREDVMKSPDVEIIKSRIIYSDEDYIIGMMRIRNNIEAYFPDMNYSIGLKVYENTVDGEDFTEAYTLGRNESVKFSIGPSQEKDIYFAYTIPEYIPSGVNQLDVTFSTRTVSLVTGEVSIPLEKELRPKNTDFLLPDLKGNGIHVWDIDGEIIGADVGPNILPTTNPIAKINLISTFDEEVKVTPKISIYKRSKEYLSTPVSTTTGTPVTFIPDESKTIELKVPVMTESDSYLVRVELLDSRGNPISYEYDFRYVVKGVNGKIIASYLTDNENGLKLNIFAMGPADAENKLTDATLNCKIMASDWSEVYYEETFVANLRNVLGRKIIPLERYNKPVTISLKLEKAGVIYDEISFYANLQDLKSNDFEFLDVYEQDKKEAVAILNAMGIISGYPDGTFRPNNNITRAEFTVIATRLAGLEVVPGQPSVFTDVVPEHWAKDYINLAQAHGCISGYGNGIFKPDNNVTIAESITILVNVLNYKEKANSNGFTWPLNYLEVANEFGLKDGVQYDSYMEPATRGNVSIMTLRSLLHKLGKGGN